MDYYKRTRCCWGCCSLKTGSTIAVAICLVECVVGFFWNIQLLMQFNEKQPVEMLQKVLNVTTLDDYEVVHGLALSSFGLHLVWLLAGLMVLRANAILSSSLLTPFGFIVYLQTLFDVGSSIYFTIRFQDYYISPIQIYGDGPTKALSYLTLAVLFSRGALFWFLNLYLAQIVDLRSKEINHNKSMLALYFISNLSPRPSCNPDLNACSNEQPPPYCSSYLRKYITDLKMKDSRGCSSWSLNGDAFEGTTSFENPLFPRLAPSSISDLGEARPPPHYGTVQAMESSAYHHTNNNEVLPC